MIYGPPQVMLLAVDFDEDFIDEEGITITSVLSFQSSNVYSPKLDTPETNRLSADSDSSFGK